MSSSVDVRFAACFGMLAMLLAGCAAQGSGVLPAPQPNAVTAFQSSNSTGNAVFSIVVPVAAAIRRHYVSPATKSIVLAVWNAKHTAVVARLKRDLKPGPNAISFTLPAQNYSLDISAYDGSKGQGNVLESYSHFPLAVKAGTTVTISAVLEGIAKTAEILPESDADFTAGNQRQGFQLAGMAPQRFDVFSRDADGNVILGPGAPKVSLKSSSSNLAVLGGTQKNPNRFTVTRTAYIGAPVTLTATAGKVSAHAILTSVPLVYGYSDCFVAEYVPWSNVPVRSIVAGLSGKMAYSKYYQQNQILALDGSGNLYVLDAPANDAVVYAPGSVKPSRTISSGVSNPAAEAFDAFGNLYIANDSNSVTVYAPGSSAAETTITSGVNVPVAIAFDSFHQLYVENTGNNSVTVYAAGLTTPEYTITAGVDIPYGMAIDGSDYLYVGSADNAGEDTVTLYARGTASVAKTYDLGASTIFSSAFLGGVAVDASGDLCVAITGEVKCGDAAQGGLVSIITNFPLIANKDFAPAMIYDRNAKLYVTAAQPTTDVVRIFPPWSSGFTKYPSPEAVFTGSSSIFGIAVQN